MNAAWLLPLVLSSCVAYHHETGTTSGNYESDTLLAIGGITDQRGADGSSMTNDGQKSWQDTGNMVVGGIAAKGVVTVGVAKEHSAQHGQTLDAVKAADARAPTLTTVTNTDGSISQVVTQPPTSALSLLGKKIK